MTVVEMRGSYYVIVCDKLERFRSATASPANIRDEIKRDCSAGVRMSATQTATKTN